MTSLPFCSSRSSVRDSRGFAAQVDQLFGVLEENLAGVGEHALARRAVEQRLAQFVLEFANGLADGGLGAEEFLGGAREAVLAGYGQKDFELGKLHAGGSLIKSRVIH